MTHAAISPSEILLNKSSRYERWRTFLKCVISVFILPRRRWFGRIVSWLLFGRKAVDSEAGADPVFRCGCCVRPSRDGLTNMYSSDLPSLNNVRFYLKEADCIYKCVVFAEVWVSDISSSESIELDSNKVFLGINVTLGCKSWQHGTADVMQGDSKGVSPAIIQSSESEAEDKDVKEVEFIRISPGSGSVIFITWREKSLFRGLCEKDDLAADSTSSFLNATIFSSKIISPSLNSSSEPATRGTITTELSSESLVLRDFLLYFRLVNKQI